MRHLHHPWKSLPFSNPKPAETLILPFPGAIDAHAAPTRFPLSPQSSSVCAELQTPPSPRNFKDLDDRSATKPFSFFFQSSEILERKKKMKDRSKIE
uniref:Uncharacterized protein MANES_13G072100 n=1 Tax=Rhizophora mucronata TaxID=61149 RepID=A0A2P2IMR1_RHIMU